MEYTPKYQFSFALPSVKTLLESGVQFGHQTKRWNPKMKKYIYTQRGGIHIIDISYTLPMLEEALNFLRTKASEGDVLFVGTKRQAKELIEAKAIECGAFYIVERWPGGILTNYEMTRRNLDRLNELEKELKEGVEDRTKQEIMWMKVEWERLDRLYRGIKTMKQKPTAMVVVDLRLQRGAIAEAKKLGIPIVALVDTNCDPDLVNYVIPSNDDALKALDLMVGLIASAVREGNKGNGVKHIHEDYSKMEVKRIMKSTGVNVKKIREEVDTLDSGPEKKEGDKVRFYRVTENAIVENIKAEESQEEKVEIEEVDIVEEVEVVKKAKVVEPKKQASATKKTTKKTTKKIESKETKVASKKAKATTKATSKTTKKIVFSDKVTKTLRAEKIKPEDLSKMSDDEILAIKGIGAAALKEIRKVLK